MAVASPLKSPLRSPFKVKYTEEQERVLTRILITDDNIWKSKKVLLELMSTDPFNKVPLRTLVSLRTKIGVRIIT